MMYSPLSSGKIVATIAESGARGPHDPETYGLATAHRTKAAAEASGITFLAEMNVTSIAELRNVSMDDLLVYDNSGDTVLGGTVFENSSAIQEPPLWRPVIDGYVLPYLYGESLRLNAHGDIPILTGDNKGETSDDTMTLAEYEEGFTEIMGNLSAAFFEAYPATDAATAGNMSFAFWDDVNRVSTYDWAQAWYGGGATNDVFVYYWTHAPPNQTAGAYHGSELWYVFGNIPTYYNLTWTAQDYALQTQMSAYWANFIKTGNPNGGNLTTFPANTENVTEVMWLGDSTGSSYLTQNTSTFALIQEFFSQQIEF
jgi:carboxylesterase 2